MEIINDYFTFSLYSNVCRSLFEKHKLHFAFLLCARILMDDKRIDGHEWHHFLAGGSPTLVRIILIARKRWQSFNIILSAFQLYNN